jgi:hypothetical protein
VADVDASNRDEGLLIPKISVQVGPDCSSKTRNLAAVVGLSWVPCLLFPLKDECMAKPNYSFEKRQRELAKKKKKEEKLKDKAARKPGQDGSADAADTGQALESGASES